MKLKLNVKCNCWGINLDGLGSVLTKIRGPWIFALEEKILCGHFKFVLSLVTTF